jgi:hypothetical protein
MDIFEAVKINALQSVVNPDSDYYLRFMFRWYSKTFHTPLHVVPDLPLIDVLTAYYENMYENMKEEDLYEEKLRSSMTPEEWADKLKQEEMDDLAFLEAFQSKKKVEDVRLREGKKELVPNMEDGFALSFGDVPI